MPQRVLNRDWSEYDDRKKKYGDSRYFSCTEPWERDYLIEKIRNAYPQHEEATIKMAIQFCCRETSSPYPREKFVECVMEKLHSRTIPRKIY